MQWENEVNKQFLLFIQRAGISECIWKLIWEDRGSLRFKLSKEPTDVEWLPMHRVLRVRGKGR